MITAAAPGLPVAGSGDKDLLLLAAMPSFVILLRTQPLSDAEQGDRLQADDLCRRPKVVLLMVGFRPSPAPAPKVDGDKVQGLVLGSPRARPPAPGAAAASADPEKRAAVEEAERFGDEELQPPMRQTSGRRSSATRRCCAAAPRRQAGPADCWR